MRAAPNRAAQRSDTDPLTNPVSPSRAELPPRASKLYQPKKTYFDFSTK